MKHRFKWYVTIDIEAEGGFDDDVAYEEGFQKAQTFYEQAKDAFFDNLTSMGVDWDVIDEEDK